MALNRPATRFADINQKREFEVGLQRVVDQYIRLLAA
jgi:hypothetical protein